MASRFAAATGFATAGFASGTAAFASLLRALAIRRGALLEAIDELLQLVDSVVLVLVTDHVLGPLRCCRGRAAKAADHVNRRDILVRWLCHLDAPCDTQVALAEFNAVFQVEHLNKSLPA